MKYWLLTSEYPPFYGGGISTYCLHTSRMLAAKGHEVTVLVYDNTVKDLVVVQNERIRIVRFRPNRTRTQDALGYSAHISYEYAAVVKELIEKEGRPDIIESQEYLGIAYFLLMFRWLKYDWCKEIPIVITAHSPAFIYLPYNHISIYKYPIWWISEMERFCLRAADHVISPTSFLIEEIEKDIKFNKESYTVIPNPYEPVLDVQSTPEKRKEIVLLGKLSAQKGTFRLLSYMKADVWPRHSDAVLRLIGDPDIVYHPAKKTMGQLVKEQYASKIENGQLVLEDKIPADRYAEKLRNAAVVVVPSTVDNLPYVVMEMMAMGKIVLASIQGGQAEIITDGLDGFLFDHLTPGSFAKQLDRVFNLSPAEKERISVNARARIKTVYNADRIYELKEAVLKRVYNRTTKREEFPFIRAVSDTIRDEGIGYQFELSIVVTFYNSGKYLKELLANLEGINVGNYEILIIDDGSSDMESVYLLDGLEQSDKLRVIRQKNQGLAASRNTGAKEAKGKYLTFLDADDRVEKNYYSKAISVLENYSNIHFAGAWTKYFEGANKLWPTFNPEPPVILYHNTINSAALIFRRSSFLAAGGNDINMIFPGLEDYEMVVKMVKKSMCGVSIPEALFHYRVRPDSMVRGISAGKKKLIAENIRNNHPEIYQQYARDVINLMEMNGSAGLLDNPTLDYDFADKLPIGGKLGLKLASFIKRNKLIRPIAYKIYRIFN